MKFHHFVPPLKYDWLPLKKILLTSMVLSCNYKVFAFHVLCRSYTCFKLFTFCYDLMGWKNKYLKVILVV